MKNIELKAQAGDLDYPAVLKDLGAGAAGKDTQEDVYFHALSGRLKLRRSSLEEDRLIWYRRKDVKAAKVSLYHLMPVRDADALENLLANAAGILARVKKVRRIYLLENVRIHLDEVKGLGRFIEFEAVVGEKHPEEACRESIRRLMRRFQIKKEDLLPASYSDMIMAAQGADTSSTDRHVSKKPSGSEIQVYVDGACKLNPGPGGYAYIIREGEKSFSSSGAEARTTNNRMEMTALIEAMKQIRPPRRIRVFTDSQYLKNGMTRWIFTWQKNNWMNANRTLVKNKDLWVKLLALCEPHTMNWEWIRGHSGHPENERCDRLAAAEARKMASQIS
jgi:ribonuclease HI